MSNTTNIKNESELTQLLFLEYFTYQINKEAMSGVTYKTQVRTGEVNTIDKSVLRFCTKLNPEIPIIILGLSSNPGELPSNIKSLCAYEVTTYSNRSIQNPLIIACDGSYYRNQIQWDRRRISSIGDMNPMLIITIN